MAGTQPMREFANDALSSQSACNLVAILGRWREHLIATQNEYGSSYDQYKDAPSVLFATQVSHLCGGPIWDCLQYSRAHDVCNALTD